MSEGIMLMTNPYAEVDAASVYLQNLAMEMEGIHEELMEQGCDLAKYIYCPEEEGTVYDDPDIPEGTRDYLNKCTKDVDHPAKQLLEDVKKAVAASEEFDDDNFDGSKEGCIEDLKELQSAVDAIIAELGAETMVKLDMG